MADKGKTTIKSLMELAHHRVELLQRQAEIEQQQIISKVVDEIIDEILKEAGLDQATDAEIRKAINEQKMQGGGQ